MWNTIELILASQHAWSGMFYLVTGLLLGTALSIFFTMRAQRPRLLVSGGGGGSDNTKQHWSLRIANRPNFLGIAFAGETAHDVRSCLSLDQRDAMLYPLSWIGDPSTPTIHLEPGSEASIELFSWIAGAQGYFVSDDRGEHVARFDARELKFTLRLTDRLGRRTDIPFKVMYDDSHLKQRPQLRIVLPMTFEGRMWAIRNGLSELFSAFSVSR